MKRLVLVIGWLHALSFSLLGAVVALLTLSRPYTTRGPAIVFRAGPGLRWVFRTFAPGFNPAAFTWGACIFFWVELRDTEPFSREGVVSALIVKHELVHVRQAMVFGPLFPVLYLGSMLVAALQGKRAYRDCFFEAQAYREAGR